MSSRSKVQVFVLDRARQAAPQVLDQLRRQIVTLELPPGTVLSRAELAERFGVSQTPIREALGKLAEDGLVEVFAQHKTVVSRIDVRSARVIHFVRRAAEMEIVRILAARRDTALVARLQALIDRQEAAHKATDYAEFVACDRLFHQELYEAADVAGLRGILDRYGGHVDRLRQLHVPQPGKAASIIREHKAIAAAISRGDGETAARRVAEHLSGTLSWVDTVREKFPQYIAN